MQKPRNIKEFKNWLKKEHNLNLSNSDKGYYERSIEMACNNFSRTAFWNELTSSLTKFNQEYFVSTGYYLFKADYHPKLVTKPYESVISKCFRKSIVLNKQFPNKPNKGWLLPNNCFNLINDLIRTTIVVKYLDGIEFLIKKLDSLAKKYSLNFNIHYEARETGYYAVHTYLVSELEIPKMDWDTYIEKFNVEIQLTTELQDNIKALTHKYYEQKRETIESKKDLWQWKYESDEFAVNYLGHILHYLEGQIMEIRNKNTNGSIQ